MNYFENSKILVPIDFSDQSKEAVQTGVKIAGKKENVSVLHVVDPAQLYGLDDNGGYELGGGMAAGTFNWDGASQIDADHEVTAMNQMKESFGSDEFRGVQFFTAVDSPTEGITRFAADHKIDLIVLPSHGRSGVKRLLLGSVAEHVVRAAHCPVLILRR
ncbi:universal stress protein [Rhodopirellula sp. P2]|uniref:universal stress protein n=1 Tax=Rhodopirellula sp. P2 TaxID=2127060 RepID=UPI00236847E7|nr:universal stress protein [Rhodopirellula sp. P2]WDQ14921.1 universal stress protein [Rhodopirellula sp. P2]